MNSLKNKEKIYCVGDSHVLLFSGNNKILPEWPKSHEDRVSIFKTYCVGPRLAYNISVKGSLGEKRISSILSKIPKGSYVMPVFGEIDCRVHLIGESKKQNKPLSEVVKDCVDRYFLLFKNIEQKGFLPIVWCVPPSTIFDLPDIELPTVGSSMERNRVSILFNKYLTELSVKAGFPVISIYKDLINKDGSTNMKYFIDLIHLSPKALPFVINKMKLKGIIDDKYIYKSSFLSDIRYFYYYYIYRSLYFTFTIFKNITHFPFPRRKRLIPY